MYMTAIETREIRGITWKLICTVAMGAITGIIFTVNSYNKVILAIGEGNKTTAIHEIQIKALDLKIDKMQMDLDKLKEERRETKP